MKRIRIDWSAPPYERIEMNNSPQFNKCPNCGKHPLAIGCKPITISEVNFDEWYCGQCGKCVGTTLAPSGLVPATRHAQESWNSLVKPRTTVQ